MYYLTNGHLKLRKATGKWFPETEKLTGIGSQILFVFAMLALIAPSFLCILSALPFPL